MLGKRARVKVLSKIGKGVYSAYISGGPMDKKSVYLLSRRTPRNEISGVVVAFAQLGDKDEKELFFALPGDIFYEPEIKDKIKKIPKFSTLKAIYCLYEKSCGGIVFTKVKNGKKDELKILLVKNINGRFWSFPKGHVEKGETEVQTAKREILEETGLEVEILNGFRETSDYVPFGKVKKRVVFFVARARSAEVHIQKSEIDSYTWVSFEEAEKQCGYENDLRVLKKAKRFLVENRCFIDNNNNIVNF